MFNLSKLIQNENRVFMKRKTRFKIIVILKNKILQGNRVLKHKK